MYHVIQVVGIIRSYISVRNKPDKYDTPKEFKTYKEAMDWIRKHSYKGMSFKYEIDNRRISK